ncbi:cytochrome P450 [Multifurca ochricompacta]|uniref:Cytochrome P450 n=1 Tax=Multifurca ochricompacta TaxID=376703 RepID=A0AAD4LXB4_9AGAM|nr:cytochrome P450 [Multifurca ochricompacta]
MIFFLACLLHPETQKKAQDEIDLDRPRLPFVDGICNEVSRWMPVGPLGFPRATSEDNVYEGYFIPKERFLNSDGSLREDPILNSAFGYGRRICPGRYLVDTTMFIVVASVLSVFNIKRKDDGDGPFCYTYTGSATIRHMVYS